jgi:uncharacterized protein YjbI with pentapeptide repeats
MTATPPTIPCGKYEVQHAKLTGTTFNDVCLGDTTFENVSLVRAKFHDINMNNIDVSNFQMNGAIFHNGCAVTEPVTFHDLGLNGAKFIKCNLQGAQIQQCDTTGMKIDGILVSDLLAAYAQRG